MANQLPAPGSTKPAPKGSAAPWSPLDVGLLAWALDPQACSTQNTLAAGKVYLMRAKMAADGAISKVGVGLRSTAPAGCTNTYLGVYTQSGVTATLKAQTADVSASFNGVTASTFYTLSTPTSTLRAGSTLLLAILVGAATTPPTIFGGGSQARSNDFVTLKQNYRQMMWSTGLTALPATIDLSNASNSDPGFPTLLVGA